MRVVRYDISGIGGKGAIYEFIVVGVSGNEILVEMGVNA